MISRDEDIPLASRATPRGQEGGLAGEPGLCPLVSENGWMISRLSLGAVHFMFSLKKNSWPFSHTFILYMKFRIILSTSKKKNLIGILNVIVLNI